MKRILSLLMVLFLLIPLACGSSDTASDDPNLGIYRADTMEYSGFSVSVKEFFEEGFEIELKPNGKCELRVDGEKANGKWTLDGNAFTVKGGGIDCPGTLENGLMRLQYDADVVINLISDRYTGESAPAGSITPVDSGEKEPAPQAAAEPDPQPTDVPQPDPVPADNPAAGLYKAVSFESGPYMLPIGKAFDSDVLLELKADGSALLSYNGSSESYSWNLDGTAFSISDSISENSGVYEDGQLSVSMEGTIFHFYREDDPRVNRFNDGYLIVANQTGNTIHNFYISNDPDSWGDSLLETNQFLENGAATTVSFSEAGLAPGAYDFAAIDGNRLNYDIYDITIQNGDILVLVLVSDEACHLTIMRENNSSDQYAGKCYVD